jgi:hypothetical protein
VTVHAPDSMSDGELLTNATLQAIERPRSVDSPHAAARAARALDRAWVVEITRDGSIERGLASLRPDWNGRTAEPGTGHLGTVFASPPQPADVVGSREDLRGADRQATQAALDLGFGRLGQQSVVGSTTDAGMRNLYHAMDAPQQRIAFTDVRIDRKALIAAIGEIGDGRAPMASRPLIARALDAPDVDAALATLARSARDALNARSADGGLRPVLERAPGDASRQPPGTGEAAREVLGLPDGVVRYEFRFTRPPALTAVDPRAPLPARWGDAEALNAPVAAAPAAGAPGETRYWPPASGGENGRAEMSELELAKHVDEARTLLGAGVDPVQWGLGIRAWQRLDDGRFAVAVRHVPGEPLSSLSLPPAALREIGRQLEARIAGLRERGLQPTDLKPEHVRVTRTADGAIDSVRLIDPQLFPVRFASGWTPQSDDVLGPLLEGRHPLPPQASAPPRQGAATRSDPAPRTAGLATDAQRRDPEALRAAIEPARSDVQGLVVPVHPLQALPALRRALDPPDAVRGLQRLADAAGGALDARAQHDALGMRPGITPEAVPLVDVSAHDDPRRPKDPILTVWDRSQVFGRFRDPVSIKGAVGTAGSKLKPFQEGLVSQIEPVIPISGSTTFDPTAPDQVAVRQWLHDRGSGDPDRQPGRDPDSQEDEPDEGPPDRPVRPGERAPGAQRRSV